MKCFRRLSALLLCLFLLPGSFSSRAEEAEVSGTLTAEEYAEKIKAAMKKFPKELPEQAYQDVLEIYNTDVMKKKFVKFYNSLL